MSGYAVKRIDDMEGIYGGAFKRARAELGISSFGMQVIDMAPNVDQYPEHSHDEDGQEEVYISLRGNAEIEIEGERHPLAPETMVRVGPGVTRKVFTQEEPLRLLIIGGVPGESYSAPEITELGVPDPLNA